MTALADFHRVLDTHPNDLDTRDMLARFLIAATAEVPSVL